MKTPIGPNVPVSPSWEGGDPSAELPQTFGLPMVQHVHCQLPTEARSSPPRRPRVDHLGRTGRRGPQPGHNPAVDPTPAVASRDAPRTGCRPPGDYFQLVIQVDDSAVMRPPAEPRPTTAVRSRGDRQRPMAAPAGHSRQRGELGCVKSAAKRRSDDLSPAVVRAPATGLEPVNVRLTARHPLVLRVCRRPQIVHPRRQGWPT